MKTEFFLKKGLFVLLLTSLALSVAVYSQSGDWRNIMNGYEIPSITYSDQPYVVKTDDGAWLCAMTTGVGHEGQAGQHIISMRSFDQGKTWVDLREVESPEGVEASYAVLLKAPSGRVFVFYNHNTDNVRWIVGDTDQYKDGKVKRVDSQGYFVFKYSDDNGKTWSDKRYTIPVREFKIDRDNPYNGDIRFFWNVGRAFNYEGSAYVPLIKVGGFGKGFFTSNEGVLLKSDNLFDVKNPKKAKWETLPDGDIGLQTPEGGGPIAAEHSYSVMSDGSFYVVYRTIDGHPVFSYSRDGGHTWDPPQYMHYPNGQLVKNPRAANFAWKCENGKYLYWFHNHGGKYIREHPSRASMAYMDRNPAWVLGGVEIDGPDGKIIQWSQPEVLLYDDDPLIRMSYPDLVEDQGNYYVTETQKHIARVHQIDNDFLEKLWGQFDNKEKERNGLIVDWKYSSGSFPQSVNAPKLPDFHERDRDAVGYGGKHLRNGFTIDLHFTLKELSPNQVLLDARDAFGTGWFVCTTKDNTLQLSLNDGRTESVWDCDQGMLQENQAHYVSIIVDGGPKTISFIIDGVFNDGGDERQFGWGRFNPYLRSVSGAREMEIGKEIKGEIHGVKIFNRALLTSEAVGNFRSTLR
jgi:hypothetical protein